MIKNSYMRGVFCALTAAVCWGLISPIAKIIGGAGVDLMSVMVFRSLFTLASVGIFLYFSRGLSVFRASRGELRFYFVSGALSVAAAGGGFLNSLETLTVAEALIIHYTFPLAAIIGSLFITREKPTLLQTIAGLLILLGVYIGMGGASASFSKMPIVGILWGMLAVFGMAGQSLITRRYSLSHELDQLSLLFWSNLFGGLLLFAFKSWHYGWGDLYSFTPGLFLLMTLQALSGSVIAYGAFFTSLKYIPAAVTSLLCTLEIVVAVVLTAIFVGQPPSLHETVGCAIILAAIVCASIRTDKKPA